MQEECPVAVGKMSRLTGIHAAGTEWHAAGLTSYDDALAALYRAPLDAFVAERKRLTQELTRAGDKGSAALLSKNPRPSASAWVVNQLWHEAREEFDELFASGARVRSGQLGEAAAHREATNRLVARAEKRLKAAGHGASEAVLRKVSANLAALAAKGGFEPDAPGALRSDRDPPGFEAMQLDGAFEASVQPAKSATKEEAERARQESEAAERRAAAKARAREERERLSRALEGERAKLERLERLRDEQQRTLAETEAKLEPVRAALGELEARLSAVTED
jgi:hypothetical protein